MAFLREFGFAALTLARNFSEPNVMARVNCYDGTDLCAAENITVYPVLRIYRRGQSSQDYKGSLDFRSVIKAVKLLRLNSPIQLTSEEEVQRFMKGKHPQIFQNFTTSSVLYLTSAEETDNEQVFYNVAKSLSIITAFGVVHGDLSKSIAATYNVPVPSVVALHRNDPNQPIRVLNEKISELSLTDFVKNSLIASLPELTVMNLPTLYARRQPFAILFLDLSDQESMVTKETLTKLSTSGHFDNVIFCWMNAQAKTMGHKILSEYTWTATLPMMTVVNHDQGELFNYQPEQLTIEDTSEWLTRVVTKKVRPSKMLEYSKWVAPGPHYDFLDMIDEMEKQKAGALANDVWLQAEQHKRDEKTLGIPSAEADQEETQNIDREIREELLELQKSRIYSTSSKRQGGNIKQHLAASEPPPSRTHPHVEL